MNTKTLNFLSNNRENKVPIIQRNLSSKTAEYWIQFTFSYTYGLTQSKGKLQEAKIIWIKVGAAESKCQHELYKQETKPWANSKLTEETLKYFKNN